MSESMTPARGEPESAIARRLLEPARRLPLAELPGAWFHSIVQVRVPGAADLADRPEMPGKIRGAWGHCLMAAASSEARAGAPCPWQPPCALDVLFRTQGWITPRLEVPKPYVFALDADGDDLRLSLTLFGFASDWTEAAAEALVLAIHEKVRVGRRLEVSERVYWSESDLRLAAVEPPARVILAFRTPLRIRTSEGIDLPRLVATLGNRVSGLARWQDIFVEADWRALKAHAATLSVAAAHGGEPSWRRFSGRQGRSIPVKGDALDLAVEGDLGPLYPLLALGQTTHVGSHAALGLGRYRLLAVRS